MVSLLFVTTTTAAAPTKVLSLSQRGNGLYARFPPPLQHRFSTTTDHDLPNTYREDCPLCAKYGAGPCGPLFRLWLNCTDNAAFAVDKDPVTACAADFDRLQTCLEQHEAYYDTTATTVSLDSNSDDESTTSNHDEIDDNDNEAEATDSTDSILEAWESMIDMELAAAPREAFPSLLQPIIRLGGSSRHATVSFSPSNLVLAFVQTVSTTNDDDDATIAKALLVAGAKQDMYADDETTTEGRLVLAFQQMSAHGTRIVVSAVYELADDNVAVYELRIDGFESDGE